MCQQLQISSLGCALMYCSKKSRQSWGLSVLVSIIWSNGCMKALYYGGLPSDICMSLLGDNARHCWHTSIEVISFCFSIMDSLWFYAAYIWYTDIWQHSILFILLKHLRLFPQFAYSLALAPTKGRGSWGNSTLWTLSTGTYRPVLWPATFCKPHLNIIKTPLVVFIKGFIPWIVSFMFITCETLLSLMSSLINNIWTFVLFTSFFVLSVLTTFCIFREFIFFHFSWTSIWTCFFYFA